MLYSWSNVLNYFIGIKVFVIDNKREGKWLLYVIFLFEVVF